FAHERFHRRRAAPKIVINTRWNRLWTVDFADARASLVAKPTRDQDFSEVSLLDPFHRFAKSGTGTALCPGLHNFIVRAGELHELSSFPDVVANRLLHVDIFARLNSPDRGERVPMVRCRDCDG